MRSSIATAFAIILSLFLSPVHSIAVYHVGNSLTQNSLPGKIAEIASQRGHDDHVPGWHIRGAASLPYIWNNPDEYTSTEDTFGLWNGREGATSGPQYPLPKTDPALRTHQWDAVTLQPYPGKVWGPNGIYSTLGDDTEYTLRLIHETRVNAANASTAFYVYTGWPSIGPIAGVPQGISFAEYWSQEVENEDDTQTIHARQYFDYLLDRVGTELTGGGIDAEVGSIPIGEVFYHLDLSLHETPVYNSRRDVWYDDVVDLYGDRWHLGNGAGKFIAALTTFATIYGEDPVGVVTTDDPHYGFADEYSPEFYGQIYAAINAALAPKPAAPIPEPSTLALSVFGLTGVSLLHRRRRHKRGYRQFQYVRDTSSFPAGMARI